MSRNAIVTILALIALFAAATGARSTAAPPAPHVDNWVHEPLLVFDITGATLSGEVHQNLVVYSDGFASLCKFGEVPENNQVRRLYGSPSDALDLLRDLFNAGAFSMEDHPDAGNDIPLKTLTVFRPSPGGFSDSTANTASWFNTIPGTDHAEVFAVLLEYIDENFPGL